MSDELTSILLINAYWFSLPLIGFGITSLLLRMSTALGVQKRGYTQLGIQRQHPLVALFCWFVVAFCWFGLISIVCYATKASPKVMTSVYLLSAILSALYALVKVYKLSSRISISDYKKPNALQIIKTSLVLAMIIMLALDFAVATYTRNFVHNSADSYVHLARIESIYTDRFSISSGFFQNVSETGYHFNITYPLYIPPAQLLDRAPFQIWEYSGAFFRLFQWIAIFSLAYVCTRLFVRSSYRSLIPYIAVLFAASTFGLRFFTPTYPNTIANLWIILIVIGLLVYPVKRFGGILALYSGAFLLTFTHSTYALMTALCLIGYVILRLITEPRKFLRTKEWLMLGGVIGLLMVGPFITSILSARLNESQFNMFAFPIAHVGPFIIKNPSIFISDFRASVVMHILEFVGSVYLFAKAWCHSRGLAMAVLAVLIFNWVVLYAPGLLSLLNTQLPLWLIDRFSAMNVFVFIAPVFGCVAVVELAQYLLRKVKIRAVINQPTLAIVLTALVAAISIAPCMTTHRTLLKDKTENDAYYSLMTDLHEQFKTHLKGDVNIVASTGNSYVLGAILPVDVLAIEEGHTTPGANPVARASCAKSVQGNNQYADLSALDIRYILVSNYDSGVDGMLHRYDHTPYLRRVSGGPVHYLYKVIKDPNKHSYSPDDSCKVIARQQGSI